MRILSAILGFFLTISAHEAKAVVVNVDGLDFDISTILGSYIDNQALLESQVWFGNSTVADSFVTALGTSLGLPNGASNIGPTFATGTFLLNGATLQSEGRALIQFTPSFSVITQISTPADNVVTYAVATNISAVPLPATLPLLLAAMGAAVAFRRRSQV